MSNLILKLKFGLKSSLGLIPGTTRIETQNNELKKEYEEFLEYEKSGEPGRFRELEEIVTSQDFRDRKKFIQNQRFKDTDAYRKLKEYTSVKKSPEFKGYFIFKSSRYFPDFMKFDNSEEVKKLDAAGEDKEGEYTTLKKSPGIQAYYKLSKSKHLNHFRKVHDSPELERYHELESYISSDEFKETKEYMQSRDKFKRSPEYKQLTEYQELKKSEKIKWYFKSKKSKNFYELKRWDLTFSDDFTGNKIDSKKWLTKFYWGKQLLKGSYSLASDNHFYTDGNNIEIADGILKLMTRKESVKGQAWDPALGFFPREFEFTSGLINSGESFRQQYGAFEAKIRMHQSDSVYHAFWMLSDKMVPHIDVFRFSGKKKKIIKFNTYWEDKSNDIIKDSESIGGLDFSKGFFIYRLEWYPDRMVWKINNTVVRTAEKGLPQVPMYLLFSSGVEDAETANDLPTSMDIDWVRCYRLNDQDKD